MGAAEVLMATMRTRTATGVHRKHSAGQSLAEYALVVGFVVMAFSAMQVYVKRSIQGKFKVVADQAGVIMQTGMITRRTTQYEPYYTTSNSLVGSSTSVTENMNVGGTIDRTGVTSVSTKGGSTTTGGWGSLGADDAWN
jgi:hypothetical protein